MLGRSTALAMGFFGLMMGTVHAETAVFVENRTSNALMFKASQSGAPLDESAWTATCPIVLPGQKLEVLRFNRDSGITSDRYFKFETEVRFAGFPGKPLATLRQELIGRDVNSAIVASVKGGAKLTKHSTDEGTASWICGEKSGVIRFHLTSNVQSDVEYVIAETPRASLPEDGKFRLLTYNVQFLPMDVKGLGQMPRAAMIPFALPDCDAVVLNEAFDNDARNLLRGGLCQKWPHMTSAVGEDRGICQDGGVFIASKWPIRKQAAQVFDQGQAVGIDKGSQKGVVYACIQRPDIRVHVFGTHLQAEQNDPATARAREVQLDVIRKMIAQYSIPANEPVLIAGDLNVAWANTEERAVMLRTLSAEPPEQMDGSAFSSDPQTNTLNTDSEGSLFDYVLWSTEHRKPSASESHVIRLKGERELSWTATVARYVPLKKVVTRDLSDHYPVLATYAFGPTTAARTPAHAPVTADAVPRGPAVSLLGLTAGFTGTSAGR